MSDAKIIIAAHKKYRMPSFSCYVPVQVGAEGKADLGYERDDKGENISSKNPSFCELTGLYWAWKNLSADYIGLVHYRRYFSLNKRTSDPFDNVLNDEEVKSLTDRYKVIVPKKRKYYIETLESHYAHTHFIDQLDATRKIIKQNYPDYLEDYDHVVRQRWGYMFNMMIMRRDLLDAYCSWLFDILFTLEKKYKKPDLSAFQRRFYGRVSEIIFNVWLAHQLRTGVLRKSDIREVSCIYMEKIDWWRKGISFLQAKFFHKKYKGSF
ncbi:MAG: DUF4422 domain-containing protein [Lachnospiraceae bacterium]|nr:DUF4422 domain-containing protein [Lachnospiraceae bacterium]